MEVLLLLLNGVLLLTVSEGQNVRPVVEEKRDAHIPGGRFGGFIPLEQCQSRCTGTCLGLDFAGPTSLGICYFHDSTTICKPTRDLQNVLHFKYESCDSSPPSPSNPAAGFTTIGEIHIRGGVLQSYRDLDTCLTKCTGNCGAVDFDIVGNSGNQDAPTGTCWYHGAGSQCGEPRQKSRCTHYKRVSCDEGTVSDGSSTSSEGNGVTLTASFTGMHSLGGSYSGQFENRDACAQECQSAGLNICSAFDFDSLRGPNNRGSCWFHKPSTACSGLQAKSTAFHGKLTACPDSGSSDSNPVTTRACGMPKITPRILRIVGGQAALPNSWPWMAAIVRDGRLICGGVMLSNTQVITAAHCVNLTLPLSSYIVVLGDHDLTKDSTSDIYQKQFRVTNIVRHPRYVSITSDYDVAVMTLASPATPSRGIEPACLPNSGDVPFAGRQCFTTGWGSTSATGDVFPDLLQQVAIQIIDRLTCNSADYYSGQITDRMLCAGLMGGGKDSCVGDSGGPLVCNTAGTWSVYGITSFGEGCAAPKRPGVYTRLTQPDIHSFLATTVSGLP